MSNIDKAGEVPEGCFPPCEKCRGLPDLEVGQCQDCAESVVHIARDLAAAGLLAPDALPPRDLYDDWGVWPINEHPSHYVEMRITGTGIRLIDMRAPLQMGPAPARRLAAALIAAADHAEKEEQQ